MRRRGEGNEKNSKTVKVGLERTILRGEWNDKAGFLISPRFLVHSSSYSSHLVLCFPPFHECGGVLAFTCEGQRLAPLASPSAVAAFPLEWPLHSRGCVSLCCFSTLLKKAFIYKNCFRAASSAAGPRPGSPSTARNGEVLHKMATRVAPALHVTLLMRCVVENRIIGIAFLLRERMMELLKDLCVVKITVSWFWCFTLYCYECFVWNSRIHFQCV